MRRSLWTLKVAVAVALVLNCSYPHRLQADPPVPPSPCETVECFFAFQQEVFAYLFNAPFAEGDPWAYRVFDDQGSYAPITGVGAYSGRIFTEQQFSFECTTYLPVPLDFSSLPPEQQPTPEQIQTAIDEGLEFASVAGVVQTATAELPILGFAVSGTPMELGEFVSYFVVVGVLEADDPLIVGLEPVPAAPIPPPFMPPGSGCLGVSISQTGEPLLVDNPQLVDPPRGELQFLSPCEQCDADYLDAVGRAGYIRGLALAEADAAHAAAAAAANAAYQAACNEADAAHDAAVRLAQETRDANKANAYSVLVAAFIAASAAAAAGLIKCGAGAAFFLIGFGCGAAVLLVYAGAMLAAQHVYNAACKQADNLYHASVQQADAVRNAAYAAAAAQRYMALQAADAARETAYRQAQRSFLNAVAEALAAREQCRALNDCDPIEG